ncbi:uncharacterized protein LOC135471461 [Liolophura sinensis]|uniref:uncharacterized protein LOC135471461 n=1 Tax=Liolophura sinensis TaxID=3198878 RepID=UPI00315858EE
MSDDQVQSLFEITASCVSEHLGRFSKQSIADMPVTVLSNIVNFLSAQHLDEHEDIFERNGIEVSRAWLAHLMKRWSCRYQNRVPIFRMPQPPDYKHSYFQKHFQDCLQAYLNDSAFDPSTPLRQPLRNEPTFLAKPMVMSVLEKDLKKYASYANCLITRSTLCRGITTQSNIMKTLRESTKVLETFVPHFSYNQVAVVGEFIKLFQDLRLNGCLEELHIHVSNSKFHETFIEIVRECAGQSVCSLRPNIKNIIPFVLGPRSPSQTNFVPEGDNTSTEDLYDEALSTLPSRKSEKEFQELLEATERQNGDGNSAIYSAACPDCPKAEDASQERQLKGFACYDVHCCGETARELAFILMTWNKLERLAIHYFGSAGSDIHVTEENDPDFALLCQVLLHKVRQHQLTQLVLVEHAVQHGPLLAIVKFYTSLIGVLNQHYAISSYQERPMQYLRIPVVCAMEDTQLFGGHKINQLVRAVEDLKVEVDPAYPQNRDMAAQHMAAFITSFIRFDLALTSLTIKDSAAYGFRATDEDILTICSAVTENEQITVLELDINLTSQIAVRAVVDMLGSNESLTKVNLMRISVDWEEEEVRDLQERLISVVKDHQKLNSLTLKGRLGRALKGTFLVGFVVSLFQGNNLPKLKYLDISESGLTVDDVFRMVAELKMSPCAKYYPALELFSLRNTVKYPNVSLNKLTLVKRELKSIAHNVEITFEEMFQFQAEMMAQV